VIHVFTIYFYLTFSWRVLCLPLIMKQICSTGMLDHIMVETADVKVALNRIAVVSVLDAHTLSVMPYDPSVRTSLSS
jgi:ribosome recycling factor